MFHIAVCDDEEYFRIRVKNLIEEYMKNQGFAYQTDIFPSGKEMLEAAEVIWQYDVIFLDISMEEMDGIETARRIRQVSPNVYIVFVTAYITYALEGYKVNAIRYLLKEDAGLESALKECMDTIATLMDYAEVKCEIDFQGGRKSIPVDSILYVESRLHKVIFFVVEDGVKEYYKYGRMDDVEPELRQYGFFRVHQSFLVNMRFVCILAVLYLVISFAFRDYIHLKFMAVIVATSVIMTLMFQIRYLKALGLSIFFSSIDVMAEYAVVVIFGKIYFQILGRALFSISLITVFSLAAMVAKTDLFQNTNQDSTFLFIAMGLLLINFTIYYLVNEIAEREAKIREDALFRERVKTETAMHRSISENLEKQRRRTHEYKNQLACISALVAKGQYKELDEYIGKIDDALRHSMDAVDTNNVIVNAILNTKYREAVERYGGRYVIDYDKGFFQFTILLPNA